MVIVCTYVAKHTNESSTVLGVGNFIQVLVFGKDRDLSNFPSQGDGHPQD